MADDQSRPTENDNQDAENQTPRTAESDREAEHTATDSSESDRERRDDERGGEAAPDEDEGVTEETLEDISDDTSSEGDESDERPESAGPESNVEDTAETEDAAEGEDVAEDGTVEVAEAEEAVAEVDETSVEGGNDPEADEAPADERATDENATESAATGPDAAEQDVNEPDTGGPETPVPEDVRKYERFKKMDGAQYDRVNEFLRERTYITAREWAIARLCADFRTETGVEMTKIGENLPELVPFMTDTYTPQAVNQARSSFEDKVRQAGATFLYGAMSGFFTAEELDDMMYEVTEVAKFLLEVEGVDLSVEEELEAEDRISGVMREVQSASEELRHDELECPHCGHEMEASDAPEAGSDD